MFNRKRWLACLCAVSTVPTMASANQAPVANNILYHNIEDTPRYHNVLFNDSDPDGDAITVHSATSPSHGTTAVYSNSVLYTPNKNFCGDDSFKYRNKDANGALSNEATINIKVFCRNDGPEAVNVLYHNLKDTPRYHSVMFNDSDPEGDAMSLNSITQPSHGSTSIVGDTVYYQPTQGFCGNDSFSYQSKDVHGALSNWATINIQVVCPPNAVPVANNVIYHNTEDEIRDHNVLFNDTDADGDSLTVHSITQPSYGSTQNLGNTVRYSPNKDVCNVDDSFSYRAQDGNGGVSNWATITVKLFCANDAPAAMVDHITVQQDAAPATFNVIANDIDVDGDALTVTQHGTPSHGTAFISNNQIGYTPKPNYCGSDSFSYYISDGQAPETGSLVYVNVQCKNQPVGVEDAFTLNSSQQQGNAYILDVLANDSPGNEPKPTSIERVFIAYKGKVGVTSDNKIQYIPNSGACGADEFAYRGKAANGEVTEGTLVKVTNPCSSVQKPVLDYFDRMYQVNGTTESSEAFSDLSILRLNSTEDGIAGQKKVYFTFTKLVPGQSPHYYPRPCIGNNCSDNVTYVGNVGSAMTDAVRKNGSSSTRTLGQDLANLADDDYHINMIAAYNDDANNASSMSFRALKLQRNHDLANNVKYNWLVLSYNYTAENCDGANADCIVSKIGHVVLNSSNNIASIEFKTYDPMLGRRFDDPKNYWNCMGNYDSQGRCLSDTSNTTAFFNAVADAGKMVDYFSPVKPSQNGATMIHPYFDEIIKYYDDAQPHALYNRPSDLHAQMLAKYDENVPGTLAQFDSNIKAGTNDRIFTKDDHGEIMVPRPSSIEYYSGQYSFVGNELVIDFGHASNVNYEKNAKLVFKVGDINTGELFLDSAKSSTLTKIPVGCHTSGCTASNMKGFGYLSSAHVTDFTNLKSANATDFVSEVKDESMCFIGEQYENELRATSTGDARARDKFVTMHNSYNGPYEMCVSHYKQGNSFTKNGVASPVNDVVGTLSDCGNRTIGSTKTDYNFCYQTLGLSNTGDGYLSEYAAITGQGVSFQYNFLPFQSAHIYDTDFKNGYSYFPRRAPGTVGNKVDFFGPYAVDKDEAMGGHKTVMLGATNPAGELVGIVYLEQSYDFRFPLIAIGYKKLKK